jgi:hypothetical protein
VVAGTKKTGLQDDRPVKVVPSIEGLITAGLLYRSCDKSAFCQALLYFLIYDNLPYRRKKANHNYTDLNIWMADSKIFCAFFSSFSIFIFALATLSCAY